MLPAEKESEMKHTHAMVLSVVAVAALCTIPGCKKKEDLPQEGAARDMAPGLPDTGPHQTLTQPPAQQLPGGGPALHPNALPPGLLSQTADLNKADAQGRTALHRASLEGDEKLVRELIQKGARVDVKDQDGRTPVHLAAGGGHVAALAALIKHTPAISGARDNQLVTPLRLAVRGGHTTAVELLLKQHYVTGDDRGAGNHTVLHEAAEADQVAIARLLLENEAKARTRNGQGKAPIDVSKSRAMIALLRQHGAGARRPSPEENALMDAVKRGDKDTVQKLLDKGVMADAEDATQQTALQMACFWCLKDISELLIEHGADIHAVDHQGRTPLHMACILGKRFGVQMQYEPMAVIKLLVEKGAKVNAENTRGLTPLYQSVQHNHKEAVEFLIANGASPDHRAKGTYSPLHHACKLNLEEMAAVLIAHGVDVNARTAMNETPLSFANKFLGDTKLKKLLTEHGAK